jgi:hypothetical protein
MVDTVIRGMLGTWGQALYDFYLQYSLYINAALLIYAVLIVLARRNYHLIQRALLQSLKNQYPALIDRKTEKQIAAALKKQSIPWEQAIQASRYPFLTTSHGITPHIKNIPTLQRLFPLETLAGLLTRSNTEHVTPTPKSGD